MEGPGSIGLELPCRRRPPDSSVLLVLVDGLPVYTAGPCSGRLCAPRRLVRAVRQLLRAHVQAVREIRLDCDGDAILLRVEQVGGIACHTGHERCFFLKLEEGAWHDVEPVLKDPKAIYGDG